MVQFAKGLRLMSRPIALGMALVAVPVAESTTIVIKIESQRIILAADTRRETKSPGQTTNHEYHDDTCKVLAFGNVGFTVTGNADYHRLSINDVVPDWSAWDDANTFSSYKDDLLGMARSWGRSALNHYRIFYASDPGRVASLAARNGAGILLQGLFIGWDTKGLPNFIAVTITLKQSGFPPIDGTWDAYAQRDLPYTTNDYTKQLIETDPKLIKASAKQWEKKSKGFPKPDRDWRWIEFLIQSTSEHDDGVGKDADVLEVLPSGSNWLHKSSCPAH
jgi:hypothetical protein